jgi:hypothetical protein
MKKRNGLRGGNGVLRKNTVAILELATQFRGSVAAFRRETTRSWRLIGEIREELRKIRSTAASIKGSLRVEVRPNWRLGSPAERN